MATWCDRAHDTSRARRHVCVTVQLLARQQVVDTPMHLGGIVYAMSCRTV